MNYRTLFLSYLVIAPAVSLADATPPAESSTTGYYLSIEEGAAGSDELLRGDYDAAITAARQAAQSGRSLSAHLTLCAAYIRSNALESAVAACDRAVDLAKVPISTWRNSRSRTNREGLTKAYLNRGVLRTALGEYQAANADFEIALSQDRELKIVRHNLQLNASRMTAAR
jgi:tetratricopeptide (TPR) repeat protein